MPFIHKEESTNQTVSNYSVCNIDTVINSLKTNSSWHSSAHVRRNVCTTSVEQCLNSISGCVNNAAMFSFFGCVDNWAYIQQLKRHLEEQYMSVPVWNLTNVWGWQNCIASFSLGFHFLAASRLFLQRYRNAKCIDKQNYMNTGYQCWPQSKGRVQYLHPWQKKVSEN